MLILTHRTSSTNCARIYNAEYNELRAVLQLPDTWKFSFKLDTDIVSDGFYLYSLLLDCGRHGTILQLPQNSPTNIERMREALEARNLRMVGTGQPEWNHACNLCTKVYKEEDGSSGMLSFLVTSYTY